MSGVLLGDGRVTMCVASIARLIGGSCGAGGWLESGAVCCGEGAGGMDATGDCADTIVVICGGVDACCGGGMCIGAVVVWPGGGGGGSDCDVGLGGFCDAGAAGRCEVGSPSAANGSEGIAPAGGVPAAGGWDGIAVELRGGALMIASMLARSGSFDSGGVSAWEDPSAFSFSFSFSSLSKTWVASWSSSQSMSSFAPLLPGVAGWVGALDAGAGRALIGGGADGGFCVPGGAGMPAASFVAAMFGSDARPGGGGGLLTEAEPAGRDAEVTARADGGGGSGGSDVVGDGNEGAAVVAVGADGGNEDTVGSADTVGAEDAEGGDAVGIEDAEGGGGTADVGSLGSPSSVFFASIGGWAVTCADEAGGGGGAVTAGERSAAFFPRPSKMSRSDPPPFLVSFDIRVS